MNIEELFIHDSKILRVIEDTINNTLDFILDYPVDWENNIFENKTLRFVDFINYKIEEILFEGSPTILEIKKIETYITKFGVKLNKIDILTNAGKRILEYKDMKLI